jgi:hypothetical protein
MGLLEAERAPPTGEQRVQAVDGHDTRNASDGRSLPGREQARLEHDRHVERARLGDWLVSAGLDETTPS